MYYSQLVIKSTERRGILVPGARPRQHSDPVLKFMKDNIIQNKSHLRNPSDVTKLQFVTPRKMRRALMMMMMMRRRRRRRMATVDNGGLQVSAVASLKVTLSANSGSSHFYLATTKAKHSGIDWIKTWSHSYTSLNNNIKIGYCVSDKMDASEADLDNFDNVDNFDLPDVQKKRIRPFIILCFRNSFSSLGGDIIISFIFLL